nr:uncharacterized protein LOC116939124 isoform X2 [Petromyzon marinus]
MGLCVPLPSKPPPPPICKMVQIMTYIGLRISNITEHYRLKNDFDEDSANSCSSVNIHEASTFSNTSANSYKFLVKLWKVHTSGREQMILFNHGSLIQEMNGFISALKNLMKNRNIPIPAHKPTTNPANVNMSGFETKLCAYMVLEKYRGWVIWTNRQLASWTSLQRVSCARTNTPSNLHADTAETLATRRSNPSGQRTHGGSSSSSRRRSTHMQ